MSNRVVRPYDRGSVGRDVRSVTSGRMPRIRRFRTSDADAVSALLRPLLLAEEILPPNKIRYRIRGFPSGRRPFWLLAESSAESIALADPDHQYFVSIPVFTR